MLYSGLEKTADQVGKQLPFTAPVQCGIYFVVLVWQKLENWDFY